MVIIYDDHYSVSHFVKSLPDWSIYSLQVGDLKGIPGYFVIALQLLRNALGVLDLSKGYGTGTCSALVK